ncbi:MAG: hypothetical protein ACLGHQ_06070 [Acidimicrobiia bacterium]
MGIWIAVIVVAVVLVGAVAGLAVRSRRSSAAATTPAEPARPPVTPPTPMTDLEAALSRVTDRDGRPIRERIDAEAAHVDPLRDPDDTGPLLRRALDSVAHQDDEPAPDGDAPSGS